MAKGRPKCRACATWCLTAGKSSTPTEISEADGTESADYSRTRTDYSTISPSARNFPIETLTRSPCFTGPPRLENAIQYTLPSSGALLCRNSPTFSKLGTINFHMRRFVDQDGIKFLVIQSFSSLRIYHAVAETNDLTRLDKLGGHQINAPRDTIVIPGAIGNR